MDARYKKITPADLFLSAREDYRPPEELRWTARLDPERPGRRVSGVDALDTFVDLLVAYGHQRLSFYARRMGVSDVELEGFMRVVSGMGTMEWRDQYLLLMARDLLRHTDISVEALARRLRFPFTSGFSRWFLRLAGSHPSVWRRRVRKART